MYKSSLRLYLSFKLLQSIAPYTSYTSAIKGRCLSIINNRIYADGRDLQVYQSEVVPPPNCAITYSKNRKVCYLSNSA